MNPRAGGRGSAGGRLKIEYHSIQIRPAAREHPDGLRIGRQCDRVPERAVDPFRYRRIPADGGARRRKFVDRGKSRDIDGILDDLCGLDMDHNGIVERHDPQIDDPRRADGAHFIGLLPVIHRHEPGIAILRVKLPEHVGVV